MLFKKKEAYWREDNSRLFRIDEKIVSNYFDKTQSRVFSPKSAYLEEKAIISMIEINNEPKVLDLGCGDGRWAEIFIPRCKEYVGVDLSRKFIEKTSRKYGSDKTRFYCMPAQNYLVEDKFDLILVIGLTTYMNDKFIEKMATNCRKMLEQEGKLIIRSVSIKERSNKRMVFYRKSNFIRKLFRRYDYQIIRRSCEEEMRLFPMFTLERQEHIQGTGYTVYVLS